MKNICIISLGRLGQELYSILENKGFHCSGSYHSTPKGFSREFQYDFPKDKIPKQINDADIIIFNLTPSSIESAEAFKNFITPLKDKIFILISSTSVYGDQGLVNEYTIPIAETNNGKLLIKCEQLVKKLFTKFSIIRPAGIYSKDSHPGKFLSARENIKGALHPVNLISLRELTQNIVKIIIDEDNIILNCVNTHHPPKQFYYTEYCRNNSIALPNYDLTDTSKGKTVSTVHKKYEVNSALD